MPVCHRAALTCAVDAMVGQPAYSPSEGTASFSLNVSYLHETSEYLSFAQVMDVDEAAVGETLAMMTRTAEGLRANGGTQVRASR